MKPISFAVFALCATAVCSMTSVRAETVATQTATPIQNATIVLRHIKPSLMAYWIDPQHTKLELSKRIPLQHDIFTPRPARAVVNSSRKNVLQPDTFKQGELPPGAESLTANDAANELIVRGSQEGIERVRELAWFLDKPILLIEVEMQLAQLPKTLLATDAAKMLSINPDIEVFDGGAIIKLSASSKAKIVAAPRVTTFNRVQAVVSSFHTSTFYAPLAAGDKSKRTVLISNGRRFSVQPIRQREGTMTLNVNYFDGFFQHNNEASVEITPLSSPFNRTIQTVTNANEGQTVALRNLKEKDDAGSVWILLVKASLSPSNEN